VIYPDIQKTLFPTPKEEVLKETKISKSIFGQWHKQGLLSLDFQKIIELDEPQRLECIFLAGLFNSGMGLESIQQMLSVLEKPYSYNPAKIYFDVFKNEWFYLPKEQELSDEEIIESYFENLTVDEIKSKVSDLLDLLEEKVSNQS